MNCRIGIVGIFAVLTAFSLAGCGQSVSPQSPETIQAAKNSSKQAEIGNPYPTFKEGGAVSLTVQGKPVEVKIEFVDLANTDSGYPDYLEITGPGIYLCALIDPKMPDEEGDGYYKPLVGRALSLNVPVDLLPTPREITIPDQGKYPVTGGSITMEKFQIGINGRDHWDGKIEVVIQTANGPIGIPGSFSFCVVPTW